jgi:TonB family protein
MMIVMAWLVYCMMIALVLTAAAAAWESSARWSGRPARWGWLAALGGTVTLPWLLRLVPERGWVEAVPGAATALRLDPLSLTGPVATGAVWSAQDVGVLMWVTASVLTLGYVALLLARLTRASRRWRVEQLDGGPVLMTATVGPAALGVRRGMVVLPSWVMELEADLRSLLLRHERAHVVAGDPRLLLGSLILLAAMPWNPVVWYQVLRMRNAIELDCDARVLSAGADPTEYGALLLEVGRRRGRHALVMATFAEPRMFLEQRIRRIAQWPLEQRRGRATALALTAVVLFVSALSCADPVRVPDAIDDPRDVVERERPAEAFAETDSAKPMFTPMTVRPELQNRADVQRALVRHYPPLLRDAGIGGSPSVHFFIDETGVVKKTVISRSSGYPALDEAALSVASIMRFSPALNRENPVAVWVDIPIVFSASGGADVEMRLAPPPPEIRDPGAERPPEVRAYPPADLRPPPLGDISRTPVFTPMTVRPELRNRAEVQRRLISEYPPLLRNAGIGGSPTVHFFIDENGVVKNTMLSQSSGHPALDEAALRVARAMEFSPAKNRDRDVPVWVEIPIVFTVR